MTTIPLQTTPFTPPLIKDYIEEKKALQSFYNRYPTVENFKIQMEEKGKQFHHREVLVAALLKQYENCPAADAVKNNIQALAASNTFTVTTAHQTNIFTGPLYYIIKIAHAIKLSVELKKHYPDFHFVPVYWMGCEDHDFEEINHCYVFGEKYEWTDAQGGAIGRHHTKGLLTIVNTLREKLQGSTHANEILDLFQKAYAQQETLADATRVIVNELFGNYGLVVINPDDKNLKQLFSTVISEELKNESSWIAAEASSGKLESLGYQPQAFARPVNLFYLEKNMRERLVRNEATKMFEVLNTSLKFTEKEISALASSAPEKFSPNVFLRPLYQETILPNLAYIGGGGELSYWLQQQQIFEDHHTVFPMLILRNSFIFSDANTDRKLEKLSLSVTDFFVHEDEIIRKFMEQNSALPEFSEEIGSLKKTYASIKAKALSADATLEKAVESQLQQALNNMDALEKKILRAQKQKEETSVNQIKAVKNKWFPAGKLQERHENFLPYYASEGKSFIEKIISDIEPLKAVLITN